jgi:hypothetical protein
LFPPLGAFWIFFVFEAVYLAAGFSFLAGVDLAFGWTFYFGSDFTSVSVFTGAASGVGAF